jgi:tetratricopeptide (TPR) repeat protein
MLPTLLHEAKRTREMNLALVHIGAGRPDQALPLLEQLHRESPSHDGIRLYLAYCHYSLQQYDRCRETVATMEETSVDQPLAQLLLAMVDLAEGRPAEAFDRLAAAQLTHRRDPQIISFLGQAYLQLGQHDDAESAFDRALEIDADCVAAHFGLALSFARRQRWQESADAAMRAVAVNHFHPEAHFVLGVALTRMGYPHRAMVAFENVIAQRPSHAGAHRWLARIHSQVTGDAARAAHHHTLAETGRQFQGAS